MAVHIVEDDPGVNDSLVELFKNMGYGVISHAAAETFFSGSPPAGKDTVIVDLFLPGLSGAAIIRWLQQLKDPPLVIALSGQPQAAIDAQLRGLQIPILVRKPVVDGSTLIRFVHSHQ
jgi:FixJ family two-component response regulator